MTLQRQVIFWFGVLVVVTLTLWLLSGVLLPFAAGLALAYFLDPVADRLERTGLPRWAAVSIILLAFILAAVTIVIVIVPILGNQLAGFRERLPSYASSLQRIFDEVSQGWLGTLVGDNLGNIQKSLGDSIGQGASILGSFASSVWSGGQALIGLVSVLVVTPVVAFYLLLDWDHMVAKVDGWLPRHHVQTIRAIFRDIDAAIAGFVRGQALVCLLLGLFYGTGLSLVGLSFGFLIGLCTGLVSFIPFVGSILGFVVSVGVALVQDWPSWHLPLIVAAIFGAGQFIEGNILSPRLVGGSVGLHPVWLMFALFAAGAFFGFLGLLVAVPVAAAVAVLVRFALARYLESPLYTGVPPAAAAPVIGPGPVPAAEVDILIKRRSGE